MTTKTYNGINRYIFQWNIENFPHWLKKRQQIDSPCFITDSLETTKWSLRLYPKGNKNVNENFVSLFLVRRKDCSGPDRKEINYQLAFVDKDGFFLTEHTAFGDTFKKGQCRGFPEFEERNKVFASERKTFLSGHILRVQCTVWKINEIFGITRNISSRTVFKVNRRSLVWKLEKFSLLKPGLKRRVKDNLIDFHLVLNEGLDFEKKIDIEIISFDESIKYFSLNILIIDSDGKEEECGICEYYLDDLKKRNLSAPEFSKMVMENRSRYLPNDVLSFNIEYVSSDGAVFCKSFTCAVITPEVLKIVGKKEKRIRCWKRETSTYHSSGG
ncbi:hypothetical protein HNY73_000826 [Argiope bruennichi]|uniref:MATH domain-containing protein n=1 Tax=Argiope bruennichi TaxID=94029 RepID=A0A8T0G1R9_ARGBR|nr:hypothetical protein HNY73_000826 [Argiope bruennichi]